MLQVSWVELPAQNIQRAEQFYVSVFGVEPSAADDDVRQTRTLAPGGEAGKVGFSINQTANFESTGEKGILVYLDGGTELDSLLSKIEAAGGTITLPKTEMFPGWYYAIFRDTEGNQLALSGQG